MDRRPGFLSIPPILQSLALRFSGSFRLWCQLLKPVSRRGEIPWPTIRALGKKEVLNVTSANVLRMVLGLALFFGAVMQLQPEPVGAQVAGMQHAGVQPLPPPSSQPARADSKDYVVGPEDLLDVQIFGQEDLNRQVRVNGEGEVTLPLVGSVKVAGLSPKTIEKRLNQAYGSNYLRNPQVSLSVKEYRHQRVSVTGAVDKPGYYEIIGPRKLLEVLAMAGGPQNKATDAKAGDTVHVIRQQGSPQTEVIDLKRLQVQMDPQANILIHSGDVVHVPFAGTAYVLGGVNRPGAIAVRDALTLRQALAMAGGPDPTLAASQVNVMRLDEHRNPTTITAHLGKVISGKEADVPLKDNDVVVVNVSSLKRSLFVFNKLIPGGGGSVSGAYRFAP
jgi:polysaccharide biosynthesis/export protein